VLLKCGSGPVLVTRLEPEVAAVIGTAGSTYHARARLLTWRPAAGGPVSVAIVTGGTVDGPVADEAAAIATAIGLAVPAGG
jgi:NCAIR mutase (PurE)-related protein